MRVPLARFKAPYAAPSSGLAPACTNCSTPLAVGQDWCLECGTAVPGRYGRGPGLRSALGVVGVTLLLVVGAVAAAYAALSSDSSRAAQTTASVPAQAPAAPDVAGPVAPPAAAPSAAPGVVTGAPVAPKLPPATPTPAAAPVTVAPKTATAAPPAAAPPPSTAAKPTKTTTRPKTAAGAPSAAGPSAKSAKILLDTDAATSYNPYGLPTASFGDPAKAIDGDPATSWTYQLDSATAGRTQVGLAINLKSPQSVRAMTITATSGMTVEFYGATGPEPVSITDPAWLHLANRRGLKASSTVTLSAHGRALDYLLVWITHAPSSQTTGSLSISEVSVSG